MAEDDSNTQQAPQRNKKMAQRSEVPNSFNRAGSPVAAGLLDPGYRSDPETNDGDQPSQRTMSLQSRSDIISLPRLSQHNQDKRPLGRIERIFSARVPKPAKRFTQASNESAADLQEDDLRAGPQPEEDLSTQYNQMTNEERDQLFAATLRSKTSLSFGYTQQLKLFVISSAQWMVKTVCCGCGCRVYPCKKLAKSYRKQSLRN